MALADLAIISLSGKVSFEMRTTDPDRDFGERGHNQVMIFGCLLNDKGSNPFALAISFENHILINMFDLVGHFCVCAALNGLFILIFYFLTSLSIVLEKWQ